MKNLPQFSFLMYFGLFLLLNYCNILIHTNFAVICFVSIHFIFFYFTLLLFHFALSHFILFQSFYSLLGVCVRSNNHDSLRLHWKNGEGQLLIIESSRCNTNLNPFSTTTTSSSFSSTSICLKQLLWIEHNLLKLVIGDVEGVGGGKIGGCMWEQLRRKRDKVKCIHPRR